MDCSIGGSLVVYKDNDVSHKPVLNVKSVDSSTSHMKVHHCKVNITVSRILT
jgi:hypothetical protein